MNDYGRSGLYLAAALMLGLAGPIGPVPEILGIAAGLAGWAATRPRSGDIPAVRDAIAMRLALRWTPVLLAAALIARAGPVALKLAIALVAVAASAGPARRHGPAFLAAALSWRLLADAVPAVWILHVETARSISRLAGLATGQRLDLGPTASGLDLFVLYLMLTAAARLDGLRAGARRVATAALVLLLFMIVLPVVARVPAGGPFNLTGEHVENTPDRIARQMFGWSSLPLGLFALLSARGARPMPAGAASGPSRRGRAGLLATAAVASCALAGFGLAGSIGPRAPRGGDVLLVEDSSFDLSVPTAGRLGIAQSGMFGMLPSYLALDGHPMRLVERPLARPGLAGAAVLIVPLPTRLFEASELEEVDALLGRGGSVLLLADHTDLLGTMDPVNQLASRHGIQVRFDSAFPAVREWSRCTVLPGARGEIATGIATGASLRLGWRARPLVIGRYGHSDTGDRANAGSGGFLGDYRYQPGELLGDLVLAAVARSGRGRVVVFGDTSTFQNLMLPSSYQFVAELLDELARPPRPAGEWLVWAAGAMAGGLGLLALAGSRAAPIGLAAAVAASCLVSPHRPGPMQRLGAAPPTALIDAAHLNQYDRFMWRDGSIGGLIVNLQRNGYLPLMSRGGPAGQPIPPGSLPVLLAPRRLIGALDARRLIRHLKSSGDILIAGGAPHAAALAPILLPHGLDIRHLPLGPVPVEPDMDRLAYEASLGRPQFRNAWPVMSSGVVPVRRVYRAFGQDVIVEARIGSGGSGARGRMIVIGDPEFLTDRVLESERTAWQGNVDLLAALLSGRAR